MKKILLSLLFLGVVTCEEAPNNFSGEANAFLDAIDGNEYEGQSGFASHTYKVTETVIADHPDDKTITPKTLKFINTKNNGSSKTEGIYRIRLKGGKLGDFVGIILKDGGDELRRTLEVPKEVSITWANAPVFATK